MQCDFHGRHAREKLNTVISDGRLKVDLKSYIDGLELKSKPGKPNIQIVNLDVKILCEIVKGTERLVAYKYIIEY